MSITIRVFAMLDNAPESFLMELRRAESVLAPCFYYNNTRIGVRYDDTFGDAEAFPYVEVSGLNEPLPQLFATELSVARVVAYCADSVILAGVETGRYGGAAIGRNVVGTVDVNLASGRLRATATGVEYDEVMSFFRSMLTSAVATTRT